MKNVTDKKTYEKPVLEKCGSMTEKTLKYCDTAGDCNPGSICYDHTCYCQCTCP